MTQLRAGGFDRLAAFAETTRALALLRTTGAAAAGTAAGRAVALLGDVTDDDRRTEYLVALRCSIVYHAAGDTVAARDAMRRCLPAVLDHPGRDRDEVADTLQTHARYVATRAPAVAAALLGAGDRIRRRPMSAAIRPLHDEAATTARRALGHRRFDAEHRAGAALDTDGVLRLLDRIA